jgi:hypothetical protein
LCSIVYLFLVLLRKCYCCRSLWGGQDCLMPLSGICLVTPRAAGDAGTAAGQIARRFVISTGWV